MQLFFVLPTIWLSKFLTRTWQGKITDLYILIFRFIESRREDKRLRTESKLSEQNFDLKISTFWDVTPCRLVNSKWHFKGNCCQYYHDVLMISNTVTYYFFKTWWYFTLKIQFIHWGENSLMALHKSLISFQVCILSLCIWSLTHCYTQPAVRWAEPSMPLLLILAFCQ